MSRYLSIFLGIIGVSLLLFLAVERAGVGILVAPGAWLSGGGVPAAALSLALLVSDIVLPVPSSVVMALNGRLFGVGVGAALSVAGTVGAAMFGVALGRRGSGAVARFVGPREHARATALLARWGILAIVVTRPIPLLAESVAIMAGTLDLSPRRVALASALGALPPALIYALAGSADASAAGQAVIFLGVVALAGLLWLVGRGLAEAAPEG